MTIAIHFGWWTLPALITVAWIVFLLWPDPAPTGFGSVGRGVVGLVQAMAGAIVVLIAWLVWALLA